MADHRAEFAPLLAKQAAMTHADVQTVLGLIDRYHGVPQAQALAQQYTKKAVAGLSTCLPCPPAPP